MIWAGARKLANKLELNYRQVPIETRHKPYIDIEPDEILYLNGGGGFNTWWNWTPRLLHRLVKQVPRKHNHRWAKHGGVAGMVSG